MSSRSQRTSQRGNPSRTSKKSNKPASAREAALEVLVRVEQDQSYSNLLLNRVLQQGELSRQDAALATEIVYGTIQRLNTIDFFLARFVRQDLAKLQPWVRSLLRLSFYQLYYLDRIPGHAAVNEAVNIAKRKGHSGISGMVNAVLRNVLRNMDQLTIPSNMSDVQRIALEHSHPEWLVARWIREYGVEKAERICASNNDSPSSSVRVNLLQGTREEIMQQLQELAPEATDSHLAPAGVIVQGAGNLAHSSLYKEGKISIQDESSMLVAEIVAPESSMRVLDCCAAPGGKTTHLAEKMGNQGQLLAVDVHEHKVQLIQEQADRLKLDCIQTLVYDATELDKKLQPESFDRILVDAPCSGLGVIRRKPDLKWVKTEQEIENISEIQKSILKHVQALLKPGGILVYSTCTIATEENEAVISEFLQEHPSFEMEQSTIEGLPQAINEALQSKGRVQILPHHFNSDGFFIARMRKKAKI